MRADIPDVAVDSVSFVIVSYFVQPDVTLLDTRKERLDDLITGCFPPIWCDIDATLDPR